MRTKSIGFWGILFDIVMIYMTCGWWFLWILIRLIRSLTYDR